MEIPPTRSPYKLKFLEKELQDKRLAIKIFHHWQISEWVQHPGQVLHQNPDRQNQKLDRVVGQKFVCNNSFPLFRIQIDPGRIVTDGMDENGISRLGGFNTSTNAGKIQPGSLRVEVIVLLQLQTGSSVDLQVIGPGRIADPDG